MNTMNNQRNRPIAKRRRWPVILPLTALFVSLNLILASCWMIWDDDAAEQSDALEDATPTERAKATRTPTRTPTPRPTNTPRPSPTPSPTATPSPTPVPEVTSTQLGRIVLAEDDLPGDWSESDTVDLGADREDSICNEPGPDTVFEPTGRAEVQFQQSDLGPFFLENISAYRSESEAEEVMEYLRGAISCSEWDDERNDRTWDVSPLSFPDKGDDTFSVELETSIGFVGSVRFHAVFVQTGSVITLVGHGALGDVDIDDTEAFVDLALEELDRLP